MSNISLRPSFLQRLTINNFASWFFLVAVPEVHVIPKLQSRAPGELAEMECHVVGMPLPQVSWLKNDEELKITSEKYTIIGWWIDDVFNGFQFPYLRLSILH